MTTAASGYSPKGTLTAVLPVVKPSPSPPYGPSKVSEGLTLTVTGTFLSHGGERGTITSSARFDTTIPYATNGNEDKRYARKGAKR
jgi:hypothetical protein